jgi:hypothetical protein
MGEREPAKFLARERARGREHADAPLALAATAGLMPGSTPTMGIRASRAQRRDRGGRRRVAGHHDEFRAPVRAGKPAMRRERSQM